METASKKTNITLMRQPETIIDPRNEPPSMLAGLTAERVHAAIAKTLCRQFLAEQKPITSEPLTPAEYVELEALIERACDCDRDLFRAAKSVQSLREELDSAEGELSRARADAKDVHALLNDLWPRLPKGLSALRTEN